MTQNLVQTVPSQVRSVSGHPATASTQMEVWQGLSAAVVDAIADNWHATEQKYRAGRMEHYFSAEFLMGRALLNNLTNLGLVKDAEKAVGAFGQNLSDILEQEPDAALGNGGLGRLAACFLDSCATLDLPVAGYGILYRYGLFKQLFSDGFQTEHPDPWMEEGYPFIIRREEAQRIRQAAATKAAARTAEADEHVASLQAQCDALTSYLDDMRAMLAPNESGLVLSNIMEAAGLKPAPVAAQRPAWMDEVAEGGDAGEDEAVVEAVEDAPVEDAEPAPAEAKKAPKDAKPAEAKNAKKAKNAKGAKPAIKKVS